MIWELGDNVVGVVVQGISGRAESPDHSALKWRRTLYGDVPSDYII